MKCEAIDRLRSQFGVKRMCRALDMTQRAYYQWKKQESKRNQRIISEITLVQAVNKVFTDFRNVFGVRKIHNQLALDKTRVSEWKVRRIMRENGLYSVVQKKYKPYSNQKPICGGKWRIFRYF